METTLKRTNSNWVTILLWLFVNVIGFSLAGIMFHNFPLAYFPSLLNRLGSFSLSPAIFGLLIGGIPVLLIGGVQQIILRRYLPLSRWWIVSVSVGMGIMHFLSDGFENARDLSIAVLLGGLSVGLFQWILLRPHLPSAGWWILASVIGWFLGWAMGFALLRAGVTLYLGWIPWESYVKQHGLLGGMVGLTYGLSTGLLLMWLMKRRSE